MDRASVGMAGVHSPNDTGFRPSGRGSACCNPHNRQHTMSRLTLTFDNGPFPGSTENVLDELARRSILSTFFLVGRQLLLPGAVELAKKMKSAGHWLGNHTMTHSAPLGLREDDGHPVEEIGAAENLIGSLAQTPKLFRPNGRAKYGKHLLSEASVAYLVEHRYTVATWTSVPGDFEPPWDAWVPKALADIRSNDWTVLVLHDRGSGGMAYLSEFLDSLPKDVEIVQEFPDKCLPIKDGKIQASLPEVMTTHHDAN
jgi:peptidoglycan-N-acetylglucosamine deacetylase